VATRSHLRSSVGRPPTLRSRRQDLGLRPWGLARAVPAALRVFTLQDAILALYLCAALVILLATSSEHGLEAAACARRLLVGLAVTSTGAYVARAGFGGPTWIRAGVYRLCLVGVLVDTYLMLRDLLPLVRTDTVDATLHQLDLRLFGVEPALWLERFNRPAIVEWFSFFYFSYFWIGIAYMIAVIWLQRSGRATTELSIGVLLVFCIGQLGYMAVPGFGPVQHLAAEFQRPIDGGFFWSCVTHAVAAGGANKDVFPSLHTAAPTFFTLYAWRRATRDRRWRLPAIATGFFAANIIVSTMLLRWHFAVDVVAGLVLGISAALAAPRLALAEERVRQRFGVAPPWDFGWVRDCAEGEVEGQAEAQAAARAEAQASTSGSRSTSEINTSSPETAPASLAPSRVRYPRSVGV